MSEEPKGARHLIIGCSAAGLNGALAVRKVDPRAQIVLLTNEAAGHYSRPLLSYYLAGEVDDERVLYQGRDLLDGIGARLLRGKTVVTIEHSGRQLVTCADGSTYPYDRLLIACGGIAKEPGVSGIGLPGVFHFRSLADAKAVRDWIPRTDVCVFMGGGLVSLKVAEALRKRGVREVHLVVESDRVMSQAMDRAGAALLERRLARHGVLTHAGESVSKILGRSGDEGESVRAVMLRNGAEIPCQMVLVGKGVKPNLDVVKGTGIATDSGILVDGRMETSIKGIFAAGDVAQAQDVVFGGRRVNALWPLATEQGWVAGSNMAGAAVAFPGSVAMNSLVVFGLPVITMGLASVEEEGADLRVLRHLDERREVYRKLVLRGGRLVGAAVVGHTGASCLVGLARSGADVSGFAEELLVRGRCDPHLVTASRTSTGSRSVPPAAIVVDPRRCLHCRSCELACAFAHSGAESLAEAVGTPAIRRIRLERSGRSFVPLVCHHCAEALCVHACIAGARRPTADGIRTDDARCVSCGSCYMVCPVGAIFRDPRDGSYASCDRCGDGVLRCVEACPTGALLVAPKMAAPGVHHQISQPSREVKR